MIPLPYEYHPDARIEVQETGYWYAERDLDAADRFYNALAEAIENVTALSETWPAYLHGTRRYVLRRFPFSLIYRERNGVIQVIARAHHRREPGYWKRRAD